MNNAALRALNGFGWGARPGEGTRVGDPKQWLHMQLSGGAPLLAAPADASRDTIDAAVRDFRAAGPGDDVERREARQQARRRLIEIASAESAAALSARLITERPFVERLASFWSNHLCVSTAAKVLVAPLAGRYEREAIRPHVLGRFEDMVLASARHPAMLIYLDNFQSIGPGSPGARLAGRNGRRGLNENYARELMELHTLGVNGGYSQQDVQALAKILTGWTVEGLVQGRGVATRRFAPLKDPRTQTNGIAFGFREALHEPGAKALLGVTYHTDGAAEGERAIRALCRHPSTATFVATKLVAHFVSDDPPPSAVDRLARVFKDTDGDLQAVASAIVDLPEAWADSARKFRTPQEWLVASLRAVGATSVPPATLPLLRQLRHPLWAPAAPKGFGDTTQEWADPDSLMNRAELARTLMRRLRLPRTDPQTLLDVVDLAHDDPLRRLVADPSVAANDRTALLLAGPAFQWR